MAKGEVVGVRVDDLMLFFNALNRCAGYFQATDLAENFRSGNPQPQPKPSRHTQMVTKARDRVSGYLEEDDDELQPTE